MHVTCQSCNPPVPAAFAIRSHFPVSKMTRNGQAAADAAERQSAAPTEAWIMGERPGFLIRRLHQIHVGLFMGICADLQITPLQYSVLSTVAAEGPADQTAIANAVYLDRTTTTGIIKRLAARGLVERTGSALDRRRQVSQATPEGQAFLKKVEARVKQAHAETLMPLAPEEQKHLIDMMGRIVDARQDEGGDQLLTI